MSKRFKTNHLNITWSTSRGRDTYGYNICRLDSRETGKRYKTCGGGYDMVGTVFGMYLASEYQSALVAHVATLKTEDCGYAVPGYKKVADLYGLTIRPNGTVSLDGACGINSMIRVAEAIGLEVQWIGNRKGHTMGYIVAEALPE